MRYFVIQRKKDGRYYDGFGFAKYGRLYGKLINATIYNSNSISPKDIVLKGERAIEVEQVWRKVGK